MVICAALGLVLTVACGGGDRRHPAAGATPGQAEVPSSAGVPAQNQVVLLFPGIDDDLLHAEKRNVVGIEVPEERAKQCLEELFRGPSPGLLAAVPAGVTVRGVYILEDGTSYADISPELATGLNGSTRELLSIYAIVDTLAMNLPGIKRVGILINGAPHETLGGHVFTGQPLLPDFQYVEAGVQPPAPASGQASAAAPGAAENSLDGTGSPAGAAASPPGGASNPPGGATNPPGGATNPPTGAEKPSGAAGNTPGAAGKPAGATEKPSGSGAKPPAAEKPAGPAEKPPTPEEKPPGAGDDDSEDADSTAAPPPPPSGGPGQTRRVALPHFVRTLLESGQEFMPMADKAEGQPEGWEARTASGLST